MILRRRTPHQISASVALAGPGALVPRQKIEEGATRRRSQTSWNIARGPTGRSKSVDRGPWTVDRGPWTVDRGPWTVDRGPWTVDRGPRTVDRGPRTADRVPRTVYRGPFTVHRSPFTSFTPHRARASRLPSLRE